MKRWIVFLLLPIFPGIADAFPFETTVLNAESTYSAAGVSDIDRDGDLDIICGGWWYEAPEWKRHFVRDVPEIRGRFDGYSHLPLDVNADGDLDFINVNYRSEAIYWVERPDSLGEPWVSHTIALPGAMENGMLADVDGDSVTDILPSGARFSAWWRGSRDEKGRYSFERHDLVPPLQGHGLGFGDINGDGRDDIVGVSGWAEAPEDRVGGEWTWYGEFELEKRASIPVLVEDVDGDGDNDLVWSSAHDYGVFWLEQEHEGNARKWTRHMIDETWSQGHTPMWVDLDGNGISEFVCGKRFLAHEGKDAGANDPLVIFSYEFQKDTHDWKRRTVSEGNSVGWGLSPVAVDIDDDGDIDLVCPGRSGLHLLINEQGQR